MKRLIIVVAMVAFMIGLASPAHAQYCAPDDYSPSCQAQRRCEETRERLGRLGEILISCTQ